jgi:hypothetical protein
MSQPSYIQNRLNALSAEQQVDILRRALDLQKENPRYQTDDCIGLAMGIPLFPKVKQAHYVDTYRLAIRFNSEESGELDFRLLLDSSRELERQLLENEALFRQFEVQEGTLVWPSVGRHIKNFEGKTQFHPFDIDPALLYEHVMTVEA